MHEMTYIMVYAGYMCQLHHHDEQDDPRDRRSEGTSAVQQNTQSETFCGDQLLGELTIVLPSRSWTVSEGQKVDV